MLFIAKGKTNLKYILIVVILAVVVGGFLAYNILQDKSNLVYDPETGEEIFVNTLTIFGNKKDVEEVVHQFGGRIVSSIEFDTHLAEFKVEELPSLIMIKGQLENRGFEVKKVSKPVDPILEFIQPGDEVIDWKMYQNSEVGFSISYPANWQIRDKIIATQFSASDAKCQSIEIVDSPVSGISGGGAAFFHSGVQICTKILKDDLTLDQFMQETYKDNLSKWFAKTKLNDMLVYQELPGVSMAVKHIFLQTSAYRLEINAFAVGMNPDQTVQRVAQVKEILQSFSLF